MMLQQQRKVLQQPELQGLTSRGERLPSRYMQQTPECALQHSSDMQPIAPFLQQIKMHLQQNESLLQQNFEHLQHLLLTERLEA